MSFLTGILSSAFVSIFEWLSKKAVEGIAFLVDFFDLKKEQQSKLSQAQIVEDLANQIKTLALQGKPIPDELKEKLREASRKLVRDSVVTLID